MKKNIFHAASLRLTGLYLTTIMTISLIFSIGLYQVSSQEVARGIRRDSGPIGQIMRFLEPEEIEAFVAAQDEAIESARLRIKANLFVINVFILLSGGAVSYWFARRTLKPIEEAHAAQNRFTADASHELRTPIAAMRIENELALTDPKLTLKQAKQQLVSNIEELDKLTALSEGLLQLARLQDQRAVTNLDEIQIKKPLEDAINRVKPLAEKKNILIKRDRFSSANVQADETRLREVFVTLLDNAIKYSDEKSTIHVNCTKRSRTVRVTIKDSGIGIAPVHLPHIFERFYRADDARSESGVNGYGIGLSIAKETMEQFNGTIEVSSDVGRGTTFTVIIPTV